MKPLVSQDPIWIPTNPTQIAEGNKPSVEISHQVITGRAYIIQACSTKADQYCGEMVYKMCAASSQRQRVLSLSPMSVHENNY